MRSGTLARGPVSSPPGAPPRPLLALVRIGRAYCSTCGRHVCLARPTLAELAIAGAVAAAAHPGGGRPS